MENDRKQSLISSKYLKYLSYLQKVDNDAAKTIAAIVAQAEQSEHAGFREAVRGMLLQTMPDNLSIEQRLDQEWFQADPSRTKTYDHRPIPIREWLDGYPDADEAPSGLRYTIRSTVREVLIEVFDNPDQYDEVVIIGGIGIGKSYLSGAGAAYLVHRLLCLKNPKQHFGLGSSVPIAIMNMSVNALQAKKVVFNQVGDAVRSPWFQQHGYLPDPTISSQLILPKHLEVIPGNSQETSFVGFDLYTGILDEGAWHEVTNTKDYAEEGYYAMQRRIKSRFPGKGKLFIITSPRYVDDFVERKFREAETNPRIYARQIRAWESMPPGLDCSSFFYFDPTTNQTYDEHEMTPELHARVENDHPVVLPPGPMRQRPLAS